MTFPAQVARYSNRGIVANDDTKNEFAYEDPTLINPEALEPTSGRKNWKIKHHKSIKKKPKKFKNGFQGDI